MIVEYWDLLRGDTSKWSSRPYILKLIQDSGQPALDVATSSIERLLDHVINMPEAGLRSAASVQQRLELIRCNRALASS